MNFTSIFNRVTINPRVASVICDYWYCKILYLSDSMLFAFTAYLSEFAT